MDDTLTVYFGHPVDEFGTDLESQLVDDIASYMQEEYPEYARIEVVNPGDPKHGSNYEDWKAETGDGMDYYFENVLPDVDVGVFLPFHDGKYGSGQAAEISYLLSDIDERDATFKPIYQIDRDGHIEALIEPLTVNETQSRLSD